MLVIWEIADLTADVLWSSDASLAGREPAEPASLHRRDASSSLCVLTAASCNSHSDSPGRSLERTLIYL